MLNSTQRGLTLIEIMIAVAILAIIAAIAIPAYRGYVTEARFGTALQDIRQIQLILDDLATDNNLGGLDGGDTSTRGVYMDANGRILFDDTDASTAPAGATAWLDPWERIYLYQRADAALQDYVLYSQGPDSGDAADDVHKD